MLLVNTSANPRVISRIYARFSSRILAVLQSGDKNLAAEIYKDAKLLPSLTTLQNLKLNGYTVNGSLYEGSNILLCYKSAVVYVVKSLDTVEAARVRQFQTVMSDTSPNPHIISFELQEDAEKQKCFMIMPHLPTTLEPMPPLSETLTIRLWTHMCDGLRYLHSLGFAHMDVKPSNICVSPGEFVLIDLGSISRFKERSSSTRAYLPSDLWPVGGRVVSAASVDWWMLAMTLAEKGCMIRALKLSPDLQNHRRINFWTISTSTCQNLCPKRF